MPTQKFKPGQSGNPKVGQPGTKIRKAIELRADSRRTKIGPNHQISLSTDLGGYRDPPEILWIESKDMRSLKPRLSDQEADDIGFHLAVVVQT